ncbi:MAG: FAD-dependent oxidoreductase [Candidatus Levyibacteriota bacterium]
MLVELSGLPETENAYDVVVIGAGGAGMTAALCAAIEGASVLLVEHTQRVGGTTAWSGGTTWIPGTPHAAAVGATDGAEDAARYLAGAIGDRSPEAMRRAFIAHGPAAVAHIEANSEVRYRAYPLHPDYLSELPGSTVKGRALEPLPFDGRKLGALFQLLRPPIPEFTVLSGMMVDRNDIFHLLRVTRSLASLRHSLRLLSQHARDRLRHPRGTRLVMGNALAARLLHSLALRPNAGLAMETAVEGIDAEGGRIRALTLVQRGARRRVALRGGLVLATGGFNRHPARRAALLPGADIAWCPGAPGHTGRMHDLVEALGAHYGSGGASPAFWAPVSMRRRADGSTAVFPHFLMDRGKPGMIAVDGTGRRFVNEATSYHQFGLAMQQRPQAIPAYLIADADALRKYGMGIVRPGGKGLAPFIADGYLVQAGGIDELARKLGIDAASLARTVARYNAFASTGVDADFQRGTTAYQRNLGDASYDGPNPCIGPLLRAPFYALRLYPGDIGASTGFATDAMARVLDGEGHPIDGLYAVGNDMQSIMGGVYAGPGITLGPGLVFAYLAGRDAARRAGGAG